IGQQLTVDRYNNVNVEGEADYDAGRSNVRLEALNVNAPFGQVRATGSLALNDNEESNVILASRQLNLEEISRLAKLPVTITSRGTADINAHWRGLMFERATGSGTIRLAAFSATPSRNSAPVNATLNVNAVGNRITVDIADLRAMNADVKGRVELVNRNAL